MRQVLAGIAHRTFLSFRSTFVALLAVAVSGAAAAPAHANSKYAAIVVDANTGKTLFSSSADAARYPASLTKMMTLYLTFEALQSGKLKTSSKITFSKNAAGEPPTKLGVKAGGSVTVETAILSLVTKSANDAATALAEKLGGSEAGFARLMTAKARQLGMTGTIFRNAHGLPNAAQHSTARDMATLGIALREHFPQYYSYFSTRSFKYGKQRLTNHNRLLGRVKGVDGIKTGYTRASGFNLVSSVSDGNRRIVAVVMGGQSAKSRDNHMAELIRTWLPKASAKRGGGDLVAKASNESGNSPIRALAAMLPGKNAPKPEVRPEEDLMALAATEEEVVEPVTTEEAVVVETAEEGDAEPEAPVVEQAYAEPNRGALCRHRSDQDGIRAEVRLVDPGRLLAERSRGARLPDQDHQAGRPGSGRRVRLHRHFRQGRRDLLSRALRRLRDEERRLERLQGAEEKEDRVLRRPAVGGAV